MRALTPQQKKFAAKIVKEKLTPAQAAAVVYSKDKNSGKLDPAKRAEKILVKPQVKAEICTLLEQVGLSELTLAERLAWITLKPRARDADRLSAIKLAFQLHGRLKDRAASKGGSLNVLQLFIKNREQRGLPVPEELLQMMQMEDVQEAEVVEDGG